jgi:adenine-specific DNA-methyltransferase
VFRDMKYMGSKKAMLQNGLGDLIRERGRSAKRIVDLFCGSAVVSWFAAENTNCRVLAVDLQKYSAALAAAVITRTKKLNPKDFARDWLRAAAKTRTASVFWFDAFDLDRPDISIDQLGKEARRLASRITTPVMNAYGGHYFSPMQSLAFDTLRRHLPKEEPQRSVCLAALIAAASKCAAAPGHTAQPFTPSQTSARSIREAWRRDPLAIAYQELRDICSRSATKIGETKVGDAVKIAATLNRDDLVFVDPPYSGVQYSRFYHVLETLTLGRNTAVTGVGRYPPIKNRPQSAFSNKGQSTAAVIELMEGLSESRCTTLFTFPNAECSNGLAGDAIRELAEKYFRVTAKVVTGRFSTLGGNNLKRKARHKSEELILILKPKSRTAKAPQTKVH